MKSTTQDSCVILTSLGAEVLVSYGTNLEQKETLSRGETMVLPAALGNYCIEGVGTFLRSYVPNQGDSAWEAWNAVNVSIK